MRAVYFLVVFLSFLSSVNSYAANENPDTKSLFRMDRVTCIENNDPNTFDTDFCASLGWFNDEADFLSRIQKCENQDPLGRTTVLEYLKTLNCESTYLKNFKTIIEKDGGEVKGFTVNAPSKLILDTNNIIAVKDLLRDEMKKLYVQGKNTGFKELKEFVVVLNQLDDNGNTFLDNLVLHYNDDLAKEVFGVENIRSGMIRFFCGKGVVFADSKNRSVYNCEANPKFAH